MADSETAPLRLDPRIAAMMEIAAELRDLPSPDFKARLRERLVQNRATGGKALMSEQDIIERLRELKTEPRMQVYDLRAALADLPDSTMRFLTTLNQHIVIVSRGSRPSHWERHWGGDEMLYAIDGAADVELLTPRGRAVRTLEAGSLFICPEGIWHRIVTRPSLEALYITPEGTDSSAAKDPRRSAAPESKQRPRRTRTNAQMLVHPLRAMLPELKELAITDETTGEEADAAVRTITDLNQLSLGMMRYSGQTPWERHGADELLLPLEGEVDLTVRTERGREYRTLRAGEVFVCPQGLWHRQFAKRAVAILYGTEVKTSQVSFAEDPLSEARS